MNQTTSFGFLEKFANGRAAIRPNPGYGFCQLSAGRLEIIPNSFGEKPVLKLMFAALVRAAERWLGLRFTEFELGQIAAVRKDLDAEYEAAITPPARSSQLRVSSKSAP
jgi:hypothetical protein